MDMRIKTNELACRRNHRHADRRALDHRGWYETAHRSANTRDTTIRRR